MKPNQPIHKAREIAATTEIGVTKALALTILTHFGHTMNDHMTAGRTDLTVTSRLITTGQRTRLVFCAMPDVDEIMKLREALPSAYYTQLPVPNDHSLLGQWVAQTQANPELARALNH